MSNANLGVVSVVEISDRDGIDGQRRIDGIAALREHFAALREEVLPHRYAVVDPEVRIHGDIAVLTFRYEPRSSDGSSFMPVLRWKASSVYRRSAGEWRSVRAYWSVVKES